MMIREDIDLALLDQLELEIENSLLQVALTRHYDQRPFDVTVCDALITNGDVKTRQKRRKTFAMNDTSNTL